MTIGDESDHLPGRTSTHRLSLGKPCGWAFSTRIKRAGYCKGEDYGIFPDDPPTAPAS